MTMDSKTGQSSRWLITGAAGFIGSNLAAFLMDHGETVVGLDNFFSGKQRNINRLKSTYGDAFTFIEGDILNADDLARAMSGCSKVAHLAAQVSVIRSIDRPLETHEINATGFIKVVEAAAKAGARSLIYPSSCAIYGDNDALPLKESETPRPMSPYAASKLANEAYAGGMTVLTPGLSIIGLRLFNIFGAWQDAASGYAAVIPKWMSLLMEGKRPILFGDGSATRDFCHVDNVCQAFWKASEAGSVAHGKIFNVASGIPTRLDTLCALIAKTMEDAGLGKDFPPPDKQDWRSGEILHSYGNPDKARTVLGFSVEVSLAEGLRRMLVQEHGASFHQ